MNELLINKRAGNYTYKHNNIYYNLYNYNNKYWVLYETEEVEKDLNGCDTPFNWMVIDTCKTLKGVKEILSRIIKK